MSGQFCLKVIQARVIKALDGRFDGHHGQPARMVLDQMTLCRRNSAPSHAHSTRIRVKLVPIWRDSLPAMRLISGDQRKRKWR
jgi:hypothetical protein